MTIDTSIGLDDPRGPQQSGVGDEGRDEEEARHNREEGDAVADEAEGGKRGGDLTREDIERGNDRDASADQGNRSPTTNKLKDDGIDFG